MEVLFAGVPVTAFAESLDWYTRLFGRPPDVVAHEHEVMWSVAPSGWVYVLRDPAHAGHTVVTISVPDLEVVVGGLAERGIAAGPVEPVGDAGHKAVATDPDGNRIAFVQIAVGG